MKVFPFQLLSIYAIKMKVKVFHSYFLSNMKINVAIRKLSKL